MSDQWQVRLVASSAGLEVYDASSMYILYIGISIAQLWTALIKSSSHLP
jgi:hypothetical protein